MPCSGELSRMFVLELRAAAKRLGARPSLVVITACLLLLTAPVTAEEKSGSTSKSPAGASQQTAEPEQWSEDYPTAETEPQTPKATDQSSPKSESQTEATPKATEPAQWSEDYLTAEKEPQTTKVIKQSSPTPWFRKKHPVVTTHDKEPGSEPESWLKGQHFFGDWGGLRPRLAKNGILFELVYTAEVMSRVAGGDPSVGSTSGLGNLDVTVTLDTGNLNWWKGGTFFVYFENLVGDGNRINDALGGANPPLAPISTLDADDFTQLSAYYFEQTLCDGKCRLKIGKYDANAEFANSMITGEFINSGLSPPPNIPMPTFPDPALGFLGEVTPYDWLQLRTSVWGADLDGRKNGDSGLFSGDLIGLFEVDVTATNLNRYGGTYRLGGWYSTLETDEIVPSTNNNPIQFNDNYGFYILIDQPIYLEPGAKDSGGPGLTAFFEYSWAPEDRNQINQFLSMGAMYTGLIPKRDSDELGFAFTYMVPSSRLDPDGLGNNQTNYELFYKANLTPWIYIQPNLQWLYNVGGATTNAAVVGLRVGISG